jgi:hypothetical protein
MLKCPNDKWMTGRWVLRGLKGFSMLGVCSKVPGIHFTLPGRHILGTLATDRIHDGPPRHLPSDERHPKKGSF